MKIEVSVGEFLDKMVILEIKSERIQDVAKLANVRKELDLLRDAWTRSPLSRTDVSTQLARLKNVNESLWEIEDRIRQKEAAKIFDDEFVQLARAVYHTNDERSAIKRELNGLLGSNLIEEKSYTNYAAPD